MIYEIWMEGFILTGCYSLHSLVGSEEGETFKDAVLKWYEKYPSDLFDKENLSVWGCRLYPTEAEARKLTERNYENDPSDYRI